MKLISCYGSLCGKQNLRKYDSNQKLVSFFVPIYEYQMVTLFDQGFEPISLRFNLIFNKNGSYLLYSLSCNHNLKRVRITLGRLTLKFVLSRTKSLKTFGPKKIHINDKSKADNSKIV